MSNLLFSDNEWTFERLDRTWEVIDRIGKEKYNFDYYKPQIEVISADQMLSAYVSHAMPVMYNHHSFGKEYSRLKGEYDSGVANLAYEVVINTNPCIAYLMETNSMVMQTLVLAHASVGHATFFKSNYMFQEFTNANSILDYLKYAKHYVAECERQYGVKEVETLIDLCHLFMRNSIDKYPRVTLTKDKARKQFERQVQNQEATVSSMDILKKAEVKVKDKKHSTVNLPEDNLLYFIEKNSLVLEEWQREICRIVRSISQYFYPQILTKTMNEAFACFVHYHIMGDLFDEGYIHEGQYLEFLQSHTAVVNQRPLTEINPYAMGFNILMDVKRICTNPTKEETKLYPEIANTDPIETIKYIISSYKDSSFILNFLSAKVAKDLRLVGLKDNPDHYVVNSTHHPDHLIDLRKSLSKQYEYENMQPQVEVTKFSPAGEGVVIKNKSADEFKDYVSQFPTNALGRLMGCKVSFEK